MSQSWQPAAALDALRARAELYQSLRAFFAARAYLEVDVPLLGSAGTTDKHLHSFQTLPPHRYLQTSPEFFMKRLLAAGSGSIYSLGKAFRSEEAGRLHNPEFTLLEWYRLGVDDRQLMDEVAELLTGLFAAAQQALPVKKISYGELFQAQLQLDPHRASLEQLQAIVAATIEGDFAETDRDFWLELLFSHLLQPQLCNAIWFVYDYPASQAALAKITEDVQGNRVARRFEVFIHGVELANGYWELTDAAEQAQRFAADNAARVLLGLSEVVVDQRLVAALAAGMPECAGIALGVDRLLMLLLQLNDLQQVQAFPWSKS